MVIGRFKVFTVLILAASSWASAQVEINEARILPRTVAVSRASTQHIIRANVDLVLASVTVLDHSDRAVTGLDSANFTVLDDKNPQIVRYLSNVDEPISLVVVLDASASMAVKIQEARKALTELINSSNPQDDFSLVVVQNEPRLAFHPDDSTTEIDRTMAAIQPDGFTALWDGMYLGIKELQNARYRRKAMVVISDGGDNHSKYTQSQLKSSTKQVSMGGGG